MEKLKSGLKSGLLIRWAVAAAVAVSLTVLAKNMLGNDFADFFTWYIVLIVFGIAVLPFTGRVFKNFSDCGWMFSKATGIALGGWLTWYAASTVVTFTRVNCIIILTCIFIITLAADVILTKKNILNKQSEIYSEKKIYRAVCTELIFFAMFIFWTYARGFKPEAYGTEKFMDYGFMTVMMRSEHMPPEDLWFANEPINYYYVGQFIATYITKLSGIMVNSGYNLMLMTLAAFGFTMPFSLTYNIMNTAREYQLKRAEKTKKRVLPASAGVISAVMAGTFTCFASNLHYPIYKWIIPWIKEKLGIEPGADYWFPDATRYIGYNPDTNDKTIHEFPAYSFILGDLHAHVLNIMFVLTVLALLYVLLLERKSRMDEIRSTGVIGRVNIKKEIFNPVIILLGFFIGLFHTTNFWDFPIYFVVSGAIILFSNAVICGFTKLTVILTAGHAAVILAISEIVCLPFTLSFEKISSKIALCTEHSPLYQLAVLWAFPVIVVIVYMVAIYNDAVKEKAIRRLPRFFLSIPYMICVYAAIYLVADIYGVSMAKNGLLQIVTGIAMLIYPLTFVIDYFTYKDKKNKSKEEKEEEIRQRRVKKGTVTVEGEIIRNPKMNWLYRVIESADVSTLFIVTIALCAIGLVILPEIVYVVDIYSSGYRRANTMFKLTYQSFILFGICTGFIITKLVFDSEKTRKIFAVAGMAVLCAVTGYSRQGMVSWFGDITNEAGYKGLDAAAFVKNESEADYHAVAWLNEYVEGTPNIVEAHGSSYTYYNRISVLTGLPTIVGWNTHEWLWRSDSTGAYPAEVAERVEDVKKLYTSTDENEVRELLAKYDIDYIYIGGCEYDAYADINVELLLKMGETVFSYKGAYDSTMTYVVKVVE